jgi:hypothetical protein
MGGECFVFTLNLSRLSRPRFVLLAGVAAGTALPGHANVDAAEDSSED